MFKSFLKYSLFFHVFIYLYWRHFVICFRHYNQGTFHDVCKSKKKPKKQKLDVFTSLNECSFGTKCLLIIEKLYWIFEKRWWFIRPKLFAVIRETEAAIQTFICPFLQLFVVWSLLNKIQNFLSKWGISQRIGFRVNLLCLQKSTIFDSVTSQPLYVATVSVWWDRYIYSTCMNL